MRSGAFFVYKIFRLEYIHTLFRGAYVESSWLGIAWYEFGRVLSNALRGGRFARSANDEQSADRAKAPFGAGNGILILLGELIMVQSRGGE